MDPVLALYETTRQRMDDQLNRAIDSLRLSMTHHPDWMPVFERLMTADTNLMCDVFSWLSEERLDAQGHGWPSIWEGSPDTFTRRIEFASHFVSYHICDDGDPGIWKMFHCPYHTGGHPVGFECEYVRKDDRKLRQPKPFICHNREHTLHGMWQDTSLNKAEQDRLWRASIPTVENVLEVFDFHEKDNARWAEHAFEIDGSVIGPDSDALLLREAWTTIKGA